jgi:hypothetical protein
MHATVMYQLNIPQFNLRLMHVAMEMLLLLLTEFTKDLGIAILILKAKQLRYEVKMVPRIA